MWQAIMLRREILNWCFVGPNLRHGWFTHKCRDKIVNVITIQFYRDLFDEKFLNRNQRSFIETFLQVLQEVFYFPGATTLAITPRSSSRSFKLRTGKTFIDTLNELRGGMQPACLLKQLIVLMKLPANVVSIICQISIASLRRKRTPPRKNSGNLIHPPE